MGDPNQRRQRRTARAASADGGTRPSDLRQALADLGRVIGERPVHDEGRSAGVRPQPDPD